MVFERSNLSSLDLVQSFLSQLPNRNASYPEKTCNILLDYPKLSNHTLNQNTKCEDLDSVQSNESGNLEFGNSTKVFYIKPSDHLCKVNSNRRLPYAVRFSTRNSTTAFIDFNPEKKLLKELKSVEQRSHNSFMKGTNSCTKITDFSGKQSTVAGFLPFAKPVKNSFAQFLHRSFTTVNTNDKKERNMTSKIPAGNDRASETLTHVNTEGEANMVDVASKADSLRYSAAKATVNLGEKAFTLVKENKLKKGDVINVAKLAGIMAAKRTATLIPLCHNIPLTSVKVDVELEEATNSLIIEGKVKCFGKTGVEVEALTCVSVAALTVYDMCKAVSKDIVITDIQLVEKDGGKSGHFVRNPNNCRSISH